MKIAAYQFPVCGNIAENYHKIEKAFIKAASGGVKLFITPECALTGYPPRDIASSSRVNFDEAAEALERLKSLSSRFGIALIVGTITKSCGSRRNSAAVITPDGGVRCYHKRALWGWDLENFTAGENDGIFMLNGYKIGVRICYEVRFPEYFRELYKSGTDLNIVLFYDVSDTDDAGRYELIRSHIRTRAVENICPFITVNASAPYQTAPTGFYDASGEAIAEVGRNTEALLICDFAPKPLDFGEEGRKTLSDRLLGI